jgi:hypothetical protein
MNRLIVKTFVVAIVATIVVYQSRHLFWSRNQVGHLPEEILPRKNADGTIDYVLVDDPSHFTPQTPLKGKYWVLRFGKDELIETSKAGDETIIGRPGGPAFALRGIPNDYLVLVLRSFGEATVLRDDPTPNKINDGTVRVQVFSHEQAKDWAETNLQSASESCDPPVRISDRIVSYREKNPPIRTLGKQCFAHFSSAEQHIGYLFHDRSGAPIAFLTCGIDSGERLSMCSGDVKSPKNNSTHVTVRFHTLDPERLLVTVDRVIQRLSEAIVVRGELQPGQKFNFDILGGKK